MVKGTFVMMKSDVMMTLFDVSFFLNSAFYTRADTRDMCLHTRCVPGTHAAWLGVGFKPTRSGYKREACEVRMWGFAD